MRKLGYPSRGELVVCKITRINPNSAFAELVEYNRTGMIHVSQVASRWVRNIREFLKENQYVVCKVVWIERDHISLSVKRVKKEQTNSKLNEFKKEKRAEKLLELTGKQLKKDLDQTYEAIGYRLQDLFGTLSKAFEIALKNPDLLKEKGVAEQWIKVMIEVSKKAYTEKIYEVKANLKLICYGSDGVNVIKKALRNAKNKGLEINYISAPNYLLVGKGNDYKKLRATVEEVGESIVKEINKQDGEASFSLEK